MTVVDTSALMAILLGEPEADACAAVLAPEGMLVISAGTLAEALIVAGRRNLSEELLRLVDGLALEVASVTAETAKHVGEAYARCWGKGLSPAALNFGDCFAYAAAQERGCALLYVGRDFSRTDIPGVL